MNQTIDPTSTDRIYSTKDYSIFKSIDGNRALNQLHLTRIKKSMQEEYLFTTIMVNEKMEVIDGQHRLEAAKSLGLPVNYIICEGYNLLDVHRLNQNLKTWTADDYLTGYCDMGLMDYKIYTKFKEDYGFTHDTTLHLLSGMTPGGNAASLFRNGLFKVKNLKTAQRMAENILQIQPYYEGFRRRSFIAAMINMLNKDVFKFDEFLAKIKLQPTALKDCTNTTSYMTLIEDVYNYRRREKINLRF